MVMMLVGITQVRNVVMKEFGAYGSRLADEFGLQNPRTMIADTSRHRELAVTELRSEGIGHTMTKPIPREDAIFVSFMIDECSDHKLWVEGHSAAVNPLGVGDSMIYDLKQEPTALIRKPYRLLLFNLPRLALDAITEDTDAEHIETLHHEPGRIVANPIFKQLASTLAPMLERPHEASNLFVDHVLHAVGYPYCARVRRHAHQFASRSRWPSTVAGAPGKRAHGCQH
jgi:AraC family transcriptional regulator